MNQRATGTGLDEGGVPWTTATSVAGPSLPLPGTLKAGLPYIWVTWMTKLISGEASCEWSHWFRSKYKYEKLSASADLSRWSENHEVLVRSRVADLRQANIEPRLEQSITVQGRLATLSGKPDIMYEFDGGTIFEDAKTGRRRDADQVQVLLYIWLHRLQTKRIGGGRVVYPGGVECVDVDRVAEVERDAVRLLKLCSDHEKPMPRPSFVECRSCNIGRAYCSQREDRGDATVFKTDVF